MPRLRRGSGTVYRRGKTWWVKYYIAGVPRYESSKSRDRYVARELLNRRLGRVAAGETDPRAVEESSPSFDDLARFIVLDYERNGRRSLPSVRRRLRLHLEPFFGQLRDQEITDAEIEKFKDHRSGQGASNGEINRKIAVIVRALRLAAKRGHAIRIGKVDRLREADPRTGFFEREQLARVLEHLPEYYHPPILFAFVTGWRVPSEVLPLEWSQVDLRVGCVWLGAGSTKNREARTIYLSRDLLAVIRRCHRDHIEHWPDQPRVFTRLGQPIKSMRGAWQTACAKAGLEGRLVHDLRRTAVRDLTRAHVPESVAMKITGHKTRAVFARYNITSEDDLRDAAKRTVSLGTVTKRVTATKAAQGGSRN